jgi:hypothetical protein
LFNIIHGSECRDEDFKPATVCLPSTGRVVTTNQQRQPGRGAPSDPMITFEALEFAAAGLREGFETQTSFIARSSHKL